MSSHTHSASGAVPLDDLRTREEKRVRKEAASAPKSSEMPSEEAQVLIHELQVNQIALEMQNEELRRARSELFATRARYFDLYDLAPAAYFTLSGEGVILEANLAAATLLGVARRALTGEPFAHFVLPEDQDGFYLLRKQLAEQGAPLSGELRMVRAGSTSVWVHLEGAPAQNGECRIMLNDITESRKIEDTHLFLLQTGYRHPEEDFFKSLARYLAESLGADFVCIDSLQGDCLAARTVAVYFDGKFEDNVEYALKDTPCGDVVGQTICRFDAGVRHLFPKDAVLQEMLAESYVGTTLWGFDGKPIGLIAIIGRKPLTNPRLAENILKLVAVRAAGELERRQAGAALRESEERYRAIVETSRDVIFLLDVEGRLRWHNPAFGKILGAIAEDQDLFDRVHPDDRERIDAAWQATREETMVPDKVGYRLRAADGKYRNLEGTSRKISFGGEALWCVVSTDTTELTGLRKRVAARQGIAGIVGHDPKMLDLYASIKALADVEVPVLILGESGTGKELVASAIHREGPRAAKSFVAINCGAIPDTLIESELFGHEKGSFTGAHRDRRGRFELADGGTIFLDEIGDISLAMQVKLLRVLQEGIFEKVGAEKQSRVDVRVISASNKDLKREVAAHRFREDLFYRLSVFPLTIPPLRERLTDIPFLVEHILDEEARLSDRRHDLARPPRKLTVSRETLVLLLAHPWPGNIRELQNVLRYALIKCKGDVLRPEHLPSSFAVPTRNVCVAKGRKPKLTADSAKIALEKAGGHPGEAARSLGVSRATLYRHLAKMDKVHGDVS